MPKRESEDCEMKRHSTSPPCGNLVDGLPHDCHTKTIAKRARVEPRTQVHVTMKKLFWNIISSISARLSDMILSDYILKILIELIKSMTDMCFANSPTAFRTNPWSHVPGYELCNWASTSVDASLRSFEIIIRRISTRSHDILFCCNLLHTTRALTARYPLAPLVGATRLRRIMYNPVPNVSCVVCMAKWAPAIWRFGGLELKSTPIRRDKMYGFAKERQWFCNAKWGPAIWRVGGLELKSTPIRGDKMYGFA